jgi:hypothetical protein
MPFYVIRTLVPSGTRILVSDIHATDEEGNHLPRVFDFAKRSDADRRADLVPGCATVKEFKSDVEAWAYARR